MLRGVNLSMRVLFFVNEEVRQWDKIKWWPSHRVYSFKTLNIKETPFKTLVEQKFYYGFYEKWNNFGVEGCMRNVRRIRFKSRVC